MSDFRQNNDGSYTYLGDNVFMSAGANWDDDGHGSHVAGIMGALGDNGKGMAGVMWKGLRLISYKVLTANETGSSASGSDWAVYGALEDLATWWSDSSHHTDAPSQLTLPANLSLGSSYASSFELEAIAYALEKNVLVVTAMGNDGRATASYPAAYSGVVAVGATDGTDSKVVFSSTGTWMSVCAPGFDIISTFNGSSSDYEWDSGTSMASPFVAGLAAYMLAYASSLSPTQVKTILEASADLVGSAGGYTPDFGYGRVDVKKALDMALSPPASAPSNNTASIDITVTSGGTPASNQDVYLYTFDGSGTLTFVEVGITGSGGVVSFRLLALGTYSARTAAGIPVNITLDAAGQLKSATLQL